MGQFSSYSTGTSFTTWVSPATPSITSPTEGQTNISLNPTITSSAFSSPDSLTHTSSTWQIATDSGFSSVVWSKSADTTNKVSIVVNATNGTFAGVLSGKTKLTVSTTYYVRVKYTDSESTDSANSTGVSFTTRAATVIKNSVDVKSPWDSDLPDTASKPSTVGVSEVSPTADYIDGTVMVDSDSDAIYWRVNDAWKHVHDDATYAVAAKGVTNGDSHDHAGGDGAQIDHTGLANLNSANYTHLTATNHTDLTDGGNSTLHYHSADRDSGNFTGTNWTDLTDTGATTLHKHDHGGQDGLADNDHPQYVLDAGDTMTGDLNIDSDSKKVIFGDGQDMSIWYDGTDGQIKTSDVAASDLVITCGTNKTIELANPVYDDLRVTPAGFDRAGVADPSLVSYTPTGSSIATFLYEFQVNDIAYFTVQLPHNYKTGEDIKVHVHWTPGLRGNEENGATVGWKVDYTWANINGTFGAIQTADLSDACDGTDDKHQMTPDVTIDGHTAAKGISSMLICNIKRTDTGDDDTWAGTASGSLPMILEIDFHYPIDTLGSRDWASK